MGIADTPEFKNMFDKVFGKMEWKLYPGATREMLGIIPSFLSDIDARPAAKQIDANYTHGGGWSPFKGHKLLNFDPPVLKYPQDPPLRAVAETKLRDERIILFESAWVTIVQKDGSYETSRVD